MEKILVINSSPRKNGNSEILCDRLIEGAESKSACCEKINLREMNIGYCIGCDACRRNDGACVIKDDMEWIFQKMLAADIVVFSIPVYFFTLSAQLKTLIDRLHNGYKKMAGKKFCFIAAVSVPEPERLERTFDSMRGLLDCIPDSEELGVVCGNNAWLAGEVQATKEYDEAYELGARIAE